MEPLKKSGEKEARKMLLDAWLAFERRSGGNEGVQRVLKMLPRQMKKRRELFNEHGQSEGWEEYWDLVFPDEEAKPHLKLLQKAQLWKQKQIQMQLAKKTGTKADSAAAAASAASDDAKDGDGGDAKPAESSADHGDEGEGAKKAAAAAGNDEEEKLAASSADSKE